MSTETSIAESELICPLCEYSLRGLTEPRCPECGHRSTWEELRREQPNHPYLFERYPQRNVWSFFRTLSASFRPRKFWRELSPTVPPVPRRLIIFAAIILASGITSGLTGNAVQLVALAAGNASARISETNRLTVGSTPGPQFVPDIAQRVQTIKATGYTIPQYVNQMFPAPSSRAFWAQLWMWRFVQRAPSTIVAMFIALWPVATLASLMIFRASLRQAKINKFHVLRCVVYASSALLGLSAVLIIANPLLYFFPQLSTRWQYDDRWGVVTLAATGMLLCYRLGVAYSKYLRFDKPYLTAIASQIIVALALLKLSLMLQGW